MFAGLSPPERPRAEMRRHLIDIGTPAGHVDAIVDIACQAADNAFRATMTTLDLLADPREKVTAIGLAVSMVAGDAANTIDGLKSFSRHAGLRAHEFRTGARADG